MQRLFACIPLFALLLLAGCEKRLFHFVATVNQTPVFFFDNTGRFTQPILITSDRVRAAIDVPSDGRITGVDIEGLSLRVVVKPENRASKLKVTAMIIDTNQRKRKLFEDFPVLLVAVDAPVIGLNALIDDGVGELRRKLEGYAKNTDNLPFALEVSGDSDPAGQRVAIELHLTVKATVKYDQCVEVPQLFSSGEDCTEQ